MSFAARHILAWISASGPRQANADEAFMSAGRGIADIVAVTEACIEPISGHY